MKKTITNISGRELKHALTVTSNGEIFKGTKQIKPFVKANHHSINVAFEDETTRQMYVHQIVMYAFTGKLSSMAEGTAIHHKNGRKFDNRLANLEITTISENMSKYFNGEAQRISPTIYNEEEIAKGFVMLRHNGLWNPRYAIDVYGVVFKWNEDIEEWEPAKTYVANKDYASNVTVRIGTETVSIGKLMMENFAIVEAGRKYKVHQIKRSLTNDFSIYNLAIAYVGDNKKVA